MLRRTAVKTDRQYAWPKTPITVWTMHAPSPRLLITTLERVHTHPQHSRVSPGWLPGAGLQSARRVWPGRRRWGGGAVGHVAMKPFQARISRGD